MITIHYDFHDGTELSFIEAKQVLSVDPHADITTCCLDFFTPEYNAVVVNKNCGCMSVRDVVANKGFYTTKNITPAHNLPKLLRAGHFNF